MDTTAASSAMAKRHRKVAVTCASVVAGMLALAYASVPLYQMFCQLTGYGGTPQRAAEPSRTVIDRTVVVRFDANVSPGLAWRFEPVQHTSEVRLGENTLAFYRATNTSDRPLTGTASFNVTPDQAGIFFNKLECFCFKEQTLAPGESIEMPVSYFVDPAMATDKDARGISNITLSYTFHRVEKPAAVGAGKGS